MANDEEQQEPRSRIDSVLVNEVIELTRAVNENLSAVIEHTDTLVRRQNVLIGLCLATVIGLTAMVVSDYRAQKTQELLSRQMTLMNFQMSDVAIVKRSMGEDILEIEANMGMSHDFSGADAGKKEAK